MSTAERPERVVQYRKYDGSLHWRHETHLLGEDEHGIWLAAPTGSTVQRGSEPAKQLPWKYVQLIHPDAWWTAIFNNGSGKYEVYIDITTPAKWVDERTVEMVDLDLDVVRRVDGTTDLLDEDEFAEHTRVFAYPDDLVERTLAAATAVKASLDAGAEPFVSVKDHWLALID